MRLRQLGLAQFSSIAASFRPPLELLTDTDIHPPCRGSVKGELVEQNLLKLTTSLGVPETEGPIARAVVFFEDRPVAFGGPPPHAALFGTLTQDNGDDAPLVIWVNMKLMPKRTVLKLVAMSTPPNAGYCSIFVDVD